MMKLRTEVLAYGADVPHTSWSCAYREWYQLVEISKTRNIANPFLLL